MDCWMSVFIVLERGAVTHTEFIYLFCRALVPNRLVLFLEDLRAMDALDESLSSGGKWMNEGESLSGFIWSWSCRGEGGAGRWCRCQMIWGCFKRGFGAVCQMTGIETATDILVWGHLQLYKQCAPAWGWEIWYREVIAATRRGKLTHHLRERRRGATQDWSHI